MSPSSKAFLERLREIKANEGGDVDWAAIQAEWLAAVGALMTDIHRWVKPAVDEGLIRVAAGTVDVAEEFLNYAAPMLEIRLPGSRLLRVRPVARIVFGARGRVDLESGPAVATLLRTDKGWVFRDPPTRRGEPVTEQRFLEAVTELADLQGPRPFEES